MTCGKSRGPGLLFLFRRHIPVKLHECGNSAVLLLTHPVKFDTGGHSVQRVEASKTNKYKCGQCEGEDEGKVGDEHHIEESPEAAPEQHGVCEVEDGEGAGDEDYRKDGPQVARQAT